jgi:hypothetical protein
LDDAGENDNNKLHELRQYNRKREGESIVYTAQRTLFSQRLLLILQQSSRGHGPTVKIAIKKKTGRGIPSMKYYYRLFKNLY